MTIRLTPLLLLVACNGAGPVLVDSASDDAAICVYESSYHCDYRPTGVLATCTEYSSQAFDYLDAEHLETTGNGLADTCTSNGATWGEGSCPQDDTWVGVCVYEVSGTVGLVKGDNYYSEPELTLPGKDPFTYDNARASAICEQTEGAEWCNNGAQ